MAQKMIAYCGLVCSDCPAFVATQADDMDALAQLAAQWSEQFGAAMTAEECMCDGCLVAGHKVGYCHACAVRQCAAGRGVANCAHCDDFGCENLVGFWQHAPHARVTLEGIRKTLS
jgi:hypothetical protein